MLNTMSLLRPICFLILVGTFGCRSQQTGAPAGSDNEQVSVELEGRNSDAEWQTVRNDYFLCSLPPKWTLSQVERHDPDRAFDVKKPDGITAFTITVATDKPRFIQCYCTGWDAYDKYTNDGIEYANVYMDDGNLRTLKAKGARFGTDVHLPYGNLDRETVDRITESVRPH